MEKVAVVTGTSSGIGFETALALAREGYYTYATMRDTVKSDKIQELAKKENLKIDVLELDIGDTVSLSEIKLPEGVEITLLAQAEDRDQAVVSITEVREMIIEVKPK